MIYFAAIHKTEASDFGVCFPDLPGCVSAGCTLDEAQTMAKEALNGHLALMRVLGLPIPAASSLERIRESDLAREAVGWLAVEADEV